MTTRSFAKHIAQTVSILGCAALAGCTAVQVKPVDPAAQMLHVCIQENPKVTIDDFVPVLREGFDRHAISTEVFSGTRPDRCEYILTYTARRSWDMATYLSQAALRIEKDGRIVASADYHLRGKGGLSLMKWQGTKAKMDPVIDELLSGAPSSARVAAK
ncbi:MAG TPA: Sbal_3080 family lipoprotein [Povalibacter sp.]|uniref:Sbal_3080 family lipoprotein n=1 Tax=Povalibacter sp. TaxID=1962978 RepID=UPI002CFAD737|nr:Sbal_3080 family lipoprotein [Povalibacter sp.]HMN44100.1 Sbal_3080 family lipoprotein [Povalibacter sp.]